MPWVDIIVALILLFSFLGGIKEGAVKSFFSLLTFLIALPLTGLSYHFIANLLSFLPGTNWENFFGFFITLAIITIILSLISLIPRKLIEKIWGGGILSRLIGAALSLFNAALGLAVFVLVLKAYPIFDWLESAVTSSTILTWLATNLAFIQSLLLNVFQGKVTA